MGWLILTYQETIPVCYWVNQFQCEKIPIIADERICGDTFIRAEKLNDLEFVVSDIWIYNSNCVYACSTFRQRYEWLEKFLDTFIQHAPGHAKLIHKSKINKFNIKGYEEHPEEIGKHGYFVEKDDSEMLNIVKLSIPDCYEIPGKGYLRVPDIKTSFYLRSKGETFTCKCIQFDEEFWTVLENIPEIE